jgi:hypothetical protein
LKTAALRWLEKRFDRGDLSQHAVSNDSGDTVI